MIDAPISTGLRHLARTAVVVLLAALVCSSAAQPALALSPTDDIHRSLAAKVPDGFTLASVGDIQIVHPVSRLQDPGLQAALKWIQSANVSAGNLETTLIDARHFVGYPQATHDSLRPIGTPDVAQDLHDMGFRLLARANNHATDWSIDGMRNTDQLLDKAGIVHAGTGDNLAIARAPQYLETPQGRVGFVSFTSTFEMPEPALAPLGMVPERAGASVLRTTHVVLVDQDAMEALRRILAAQPKGSAQPPMPDGSIDLFGTVYKGADHFGESFAPNAADRNQILRAIRQGKLSSDFLVVNVHAHEPGNWSDEPADFFPPLAHLMIDNGADAVQAEGPHHLRGIEIYKGKPIFYSLGNFIIQFAPQSPVAADMYEKLDGDPNELTDAELIQSRIGVHVEQDVWYESVVAVSEYRHGELSEVALHPIELDLGARMADRGIPHAATGATAHRILVRLAELSKPFGTQIEIDGDTGIIRGPAH